MGATFTVAAVGIGALLSVWAARKTRHTELLIELSARWEAAPTIESSVLFRSYGGAEETVALVERLYAPGVKHRKPEDIETWQKMSIYPDLLEVIGVFVNRRMIPPRLIYDLWGGNIYEAWAEYGPAVRKLRELSQKDPYGSIKPTSSGKISSGSQAGWSSTCGPSATVFRPRGWAGTGST